MADKIVSLPSCRKYIRNRDIWDLRWLKQHGAKINKEYVMAKIKDYKVDGYLQKLDKMINQLDELVHGKDFMDEMSRYIPIDVQERTIKKAKFLDFLGNEDKLILTDVKKLIENV